MVLLFGLAIVFQPAERRFVPQIANLLSLLAFGVYASFLLMVRPPSVTGEPAGPNSLDPTEKPVRPKVWLLPLVEWMVFFVTLFWMFGMAFFI